MPPKYRSIRYPNLKDIVVVTGYPIIDFGKAWTASSIAAQYQNPTVVKIDPMQNLGFPKDLGIRHRGQVVSEDIGLYIKHGVKPEHTHNIVFGNLELKFAQTPPSEIRLGEEKKRTYQDKCTLLSEEILACVTDENDGLIIELGGRIVDEESVIFPGALRHLENTTGLLPRIVLLTYLEEADSGKGLRRVKTHHVRDIVRYARKFFGHNNLSVLVRRRNLGKKYPDSQLRQELGRALYEVQLGKTFRSMDLDEDRASLIPNFKSSLQLESFIKKWGNLAPTKHPIGVAACNFGASCRYDGIPQTTGETEMDLLRYGGGAVVVCPELLAGLPIPRGPFEIEGGNASKVWSGKARVVSRDRVDNTTYFVKGALKAYDILTSHSVRVFVGYEKSPSCGVCHIYDGTHKGRVIPGRGVFSELLAAAGLKLIGRQDLPKYINQSLVPETAKTKAGW